MQINMTIESCKIFWSFWHYESECPSFSYLSLGFMAINILWALFSYFGFRSIRSKNARYPFLEIGTFASSATSLSLTSSSASACTQLAEWSCKAKFQTTQR
jgi:hypothetical protein